MRAYLYHLREVMERLKPDVGRLLRASRRTSPMRSPAPWFTICHAYTSASFRAPNNLIGRYLMPAGYQGGAGIGRRKIEKMG